MGLRIFFVPMFSFDDATIPESGSQKRHTERQISHPICARPSLLSNYRDFFQYNTDFTIFNAIIQVRAEQMEKRECFGCVFKGLKIC